LVALYVAESGAPSFPATELVATRWPLPRASMDGSTRVVSMMTDSTLTLSRLRTPSTVVSSATWRCEMPALRYLRGDEVGSKLVVVQ